MQKIVDKEEIDGLLIINGVDSNHNSENIKLTNWLFLGLNGVEIEQNEYIDEHFNEMIVLIKKNSRVSIYCEPSLYDFLKAFLITIPNIELFCPTDHQYENKDEMELIKITHFIKMVKDIKNVGILVESKHEDNVKNIESWPLIQAYAQAELGYGFFSLDHKVVSLTKRINNVYKNHDKYSLEKLFVGISSRLSNHIGNAFLQITQTKLNKRIAISEEQICDILKDSYEIGELGKFIRNSDGTKKLPKPRVLFGLNTQKPYEMNSCSDTFSSASNNKPLCAIHSTVEYLDIVTKLRVARTYFLTKNVKNELSIDKIFDEMDDLVNYKLGAKVNETFVDEEVLINLYIALIISNYESFHGFSQNYKLLTEEFVEQNILKTVGKIYSAYYDGKPLESKNIDISLKCYNSFGEEVKIDFKDSISFKLTPYIYVLRIQINGITSPIDGRLLGSILFCESFIIQEGCFLLLTKDTSYFNIWNLQCDVSDQIQNMRNTIISNDLGKCLTKDIICENNRIFFPQEKLVNYNIELPILSAKIILYDKGFKIYTEQFGWMILLFKNALEISITQKTEKPWMVIKLNENLLAHSLKSSKICIELSGNSFGAIFLKLKDVLNANNIKFEEINEIPAFFLTSNLLKKEANLFPQNYVFPAINMTKSHILNPKMLFSYLESKQLVILNKLADLKLANYKSLYEEHLIVPNKPAKFLDSQIPLIIVNGSNGSGKKRFAENLLRYQTEYMPIKFHLLSFKLYELQNLDEKFFLKRLIEFVIEKKITSQENNIIILVQPAKINTHIIIDLLEKNQDLASKFRIKCIITKININNIFQSETKQFTNKILGFGVEGFSQFLILDSYGNSETQIDQWFKVFRSVLPKSNLYRIMNNILPIYIAQDIMKYEGFNTEKNQFERLKNAVFCDFLRPINQEDYVFIPFHIPLIREKTFNILFKDTMKKKEGFVFIRKEISKEEKEKAEKSRDLLAIELLKLKEMIMELDQKLSKKTPHIIYIKAFVRFQSELENGIAELTINSNYIIERNVKNVKTKITKENIDGFEIEKAVYENFDDPKTIGFLFHGENLHPKKLYDMLIGISMLNQDNFKRKNLLGKEDLSEEDIKKIEFEHRGVGFEDGEFYDGSCFRDNCGNVLKCHPKLDKFIEEYLEIKNKEIMKENDLNEKKMEYIEKALRFY